MAQILGESDPGGFNLWTSAHGFRHVDLTNGKAWKAFWVILLVILTGCLIGCVVFYFVYVFSTAVFSRILVESPSYRDWPTTIVCDRRIFRASKSGQVQSFNGQTAALAAWSVNPLVSRPDLVRFNSGTWTSAKQQLATSLAWANINNDMNRLLNTTTAACTDFIVECTVAGRTFNGTDCCSLYFNPWPVHLKEGTCFTTKGARVRPTITMAGELSGFSVVLVTEQANPISNSFVSTPLADAMSQGGVNYAVLDDFVTPDAGMRLYGRSARQGSVASVGLQTVRTDNSRLSTSAIARFKCIDPGSRPSYWVDGDLVYGLGPMYGYTKESCDYTAKQEILARDILRCSFTESLSTNLVPRCGPDAAASYKQSFAPGGASQPSDVATYTLMAYPDVLARYNKVCLPSCITTRYQLTSSFTDISNDRLTDLNAKLGSIQPQPTGPTFTVLNFYLESLEFQTVENFPQQGLQFVAELGGLMSLFLGISLISLIECFCYLACCCPAKHCCKGDDRDDGVYPYDRGSFKVPNNGHHQHHRRPSAFDDRNNDGRRSGY